MWYVLSGLIVIIFSGILGGYLDTELGYDNFAVYWGLGAISGSVATGLTMLGFSDIR